MRECFATGCIRINVTPIANPVSGLLTFLEGDDIYGNMLRFWDGEDDIFKIQSLDDVEHFKNLKKASFFGDQSTDRVAQPKEKGIEYIWG